MLISLSISWNIGLRCWYFLHGTLGHQTWNVWSFLFASGIWISCEQVAGCELARQKRDIKVFNFFKQSQKSDRNYRSCFHHFWTNANVDSDHTAQTSPVVLLHSLCHLLSMTLSQVLPCSRHFFQVMKVHLSEAERLQLVSSGFAVLLSCLLHNILHKASHLESLWLGCSSQDLEGADKNQVQQTRLVFLDSKRFQKPSETHCII